MRQSWEERRMRLSPDITTGEGLTLSSCRVTLLTPDCN